MNAATPFPWSQLSPEASPAAASSRTTFRDAFEHAPIAVARCNPQGLIVEMNPAFARALDRDVASRRLMQLCELVRPQDRDQAEILLRDLLERRRDRICLEARGAGHDQPSAKWTAWRQPGYGGQPDHALLIAEPGTDSLPVEESVLQAQRWEAIGRLAGGVVHDFNNLLTGVMLYCDLLLSSLDARDRRRRYADEIRSAIAQATGLVRQLLVFARPQPTPIRLLSLNEIAAAMRDLLTRLIGGNINLCLNLDPELGPISIDQAQAQQVLLNLVLNARDAMPAGGCITIETSNCNFQPVAGPALLSRPPAFPCVLLVVGDNGHGMDAATRQRLFEPFFTTKNAGQGTGLGLTTVRSIVSANRGLIHFESEPGRGTRVMILLPRAAATSNTGPLSTANPVNTGNPAQHPQSPTPFQETKKESLL